MGVLTRGPLSTPLDAGSPTPTRPRPGGVGCPRPTSRARRAPLSVQPRRRRRILVVDDEAEVTIFLADLLYLEGFAVDTAPDGADAVRCLEQGIYDALLVDLRMPVSGVELLYEIERRFPSLRRRIVFMTADVFYADQHQLRTRGGGPRVMIKPFHAEEVVQALREVLET